MLEKYLKMLFSFNLKKNVNVLLIILVLLILALLFFGNSNLVEGVCNNTTFGNSTPLVGAQQISNINSSLQGITCSV